jgi:hypothetical protein
MSQRVPNGTVLRTEAQLWELTSWALTAVVIDRTGTPWIVFQSEDGDDHAVTVPCPDDDTPGRTDFYGLATPRPLRVAFNGDWSDAAWPGVTKGQEVTP